MARRPAASPLNTALSTPEEFPRFSQFWLAENGDTLTIYALLEGPSVTGAYQFDCAHKDGVVMDVHCDLFFRGAPERLGVAPLTSMYWYGENQRDRAADWRPEIHDNDGLAMWTGKGERIWRPLINPPHVQTNAFADVGPKGFGLIQRDRDFSDYQDDGAFYEKRPGIWVEPKGDWGAGAVELVEIPTNDEIHDNIVAYWRPQKPVQSGDALSFDYRLYWQDREPNYPTELAKVVATRIGRPGFPAPKPGPPTSAQIQHRFFRRRAGGPETAFRHHAGGHRLQRACDGRLCQQSGRHQSLARAVRCGGGRQGANRYSLLPPAGRQDLERNLDLPVFPGLILGRRLAGAQTQFAGNANARYC